MVFPSLELRAYNTGNIWQKIHIKTDPNERYPHQSNLLPHHNKQLSIPEHTLRRKPEKPKRIIFTGIYTLLGVHIPSKNKGSHSFYTEVKTDKLLGSFF